MNDITLAPSLLAADFGRAAEAAEYIDKNGGDWIHFDVMDGSFVPEITFGQKFIKDLRGVSSKTFDAHLMIREPEKHIESFARAGADYITFHAEAAADSLALARKIRSLGIKAGAAISPATPLSAVAALFPVIDLLLVMTVEPGYGGQALIAECLDKLAAARDLRKKDGLDFLISADGGVNGENVSRIIGAGADVVVSGSAFFKDKEFAVNIRRLYNKNRAKVSAF